MNKKQWRLMQKITEKNVMNKAFEYQQSQVSVTQHKAQYAQLKKYYEDYVLAQRNKENQSQNSVILRNTHYFLGNLQRMLILQSAAVQKCKEIKEKCRFAWKKQEARRKYLRYLLQQEWEEEEDEEEERNNGPKQEI